MESFQGVIHYDDASIEACVDKLGTRLLKISLKDTPMSAWNLSPSLLPKRPCRVMYAFY
jgi:hypothetical protein